MGGSTVVWSSVSQSSRLKYSCRSQKNSWVPLTWERGEGLSCQSQFSFGRPVVDGQHGLEGSSWQALTRTIRERASRPILIQQHLWLVSRLSWLTQAVQTRASPLDQASRLLTKIERLGQVGRHHCKLVGSKLAPNGRLPTWSPSTPAQLQRVQSHWDFAGSFPNMTLACHPSQSAWPGMGANQAGCEVSIGSSPPAAAGQKFQRGWVRRWPSGMAVPQPLVHVLPVENHWYGEQMNKKLSLIREGLPC